MKMQFLLWQSGVKDALPGLRQRQKDNCYQYFKEHTLELCQDERQEPSGIFEILESSGPAVSIG
jgi:hypothetical protein